MNKITPEIMKKIWDEAKAEAYEEDGMFIDDWSAMCIAISVYSNRLGIREPVEDSPMIEAEHLAFMEGAKWAFNYIKENKNE